MGDAKTYQLALASLPAGTTERDYRLDTAFFRAMEQPDIIGADVRVSLHIDHRNDAYYLRIAACGELSIPCDRCLEPMSLAVDEYEELTVRYGQEYDDSKEGLLILPESESTLDMAPLLCDMLMLCIPMRHVHAEGECDPAMHRILQEHAAEDMSGGEEEDI